MKAPDRRPQIEAARVVLEDPERYGGEDSLMVRLARREAGETQESSEDEPHE